MLDLLADLRRRDGASLVLATHNTEVAARAGRIIRLADGRIVADSCAS